MNLRTTVGLCVLTALTGGVLAAAALTASSSNANASSGDWDDHKDDGWMRDTYSYSYECTIEIRQASVEDSNLCSPGARTPSGGHAHKGHDRDGYDGHKGGGHGGDDDVDVDVEGDRTVATDCDQEGLVNVQTCGNLNNNDVLKDIDIVKDVEIVKKVEVERVIGDVAVVGALI